MEENREKGMELCAQAAKEQDPEKPMELIAQINELLEAAQAQRQCSGARANRINL
jgi:hypothetical protein